MVTATAGASANPANWASWPSDVRGRVAQSQVSPSTVTSVRGTVKVTTAC